MTIVLEKVAIEGNSKSSSKFSHLTKQQLTPVVKEMQQTYTEHAYYCV